MKRRFFKKLSIYLCLVLLFCCLPFRVVYASNVQDQSKPIFGLSADDVVSKYNQLSDQQKDQVLRSLGNTSIFANSLFGNIFNSTFGVLDDAVKKLGDLFFQANGVVYKLGSSALAWVSRLIDKVFNNDLSELNISQPVIDDLYLYTKNLIFVDQPFFINKHCPSNFPSFYFNEALSSYPSNILYSFMDGRKENGVYSGYLRTLPNNSSVENYKLIVNKNLSKIYFTYCYMTLSQNGDYYIPSSVNLPVYGGTDYYNYYNIPSNISKYPINFSLSQTDTSWRSISDSGSDVPPVVSFSGDYLPVLKSFLNDFFSYIDFFYLIDGDFAYKIFIPHSSSDIDITNNTYFNYIYNIPVGTPLNVSNIVSNTAINYDPVENIAYYLPDQYNIEQNFSVVNNYFISSGSSISGQAIDVTLVSPSVIDVRVTNPEDISNQVHNEVNKNIINNNNVNFGDLNVKVSVEGAVSHSSDILNDNIDTSNDSPLGFMVAGVPPDLLSIFGAFVVSCLVCALFERVFK